MTESKPKIEEIILLSGEIINDASLEIEAPRLPGFVAIVSQELKDSTQYISLSSIQSLTMKNNEIGSTSPSYYITPEQTIEVRK